ncbi:TfoX/Sxy family protein [Aliikangiella sp. G2MR2-5]|uniref:TfoX/Sxy family protein n=1 Tax=Aliikangiella sp. G2MR2-5 TaxID=2788943 RepID=UPI0018AADBE0|nr:TfoX/Sxy family protein [Aliikangiella sp. G2MR2-5]
MAYDKELAQRLDEYFAENNDAESKKMFGGLCYLIRHHMCVGIVGDSLMARVGPKAYESCLKQKHVREMDFTGKAMKGMVFVAAKGIESDAELYKWVSICESFVKSLPPKT